MTTTIATYTQARALKHALAEFNIIVLPETFEMTTSGIYIPRWLGYSRIPHLFDNETGICQWYFFLRFQDGHPDVNVGQALDFAQTNTVRKLVERIKTKAVMNLKG